MYRRKLEKIVLKTRLVLAFACVGEQAQASLKNTKNVTLTQMYTLITASTHAFNFSTRTHCLLQHLITTTSRREQSIYKLAFAAFFFSPILSFYI